MRINFWGALGLMALGGFAALLLPPELRVMIGGMIITWLALLTVAGLLLAGIDKLRKKVKR